MFIIRRTKIVLRNIKH